MSLSRLFITGSLDNNTPLIVLQEIAYAHNLPPSATLVNISEQPVPRLPGATFKSCARFVNIHCSWTPSSLAPALKFLLKFNYQTNMISHLPTTWQVAPQTPEQPFTINYCILYGICQQHGVTLYANTTAHEMEQAVRWLIRPLHILRQEALAHVSYAPLSPGSYVNILRTNTIQPIHRTEPTIHQVTQAYDYIHDQHNRYSLLIPHTCEQAIALGAIVYGYNISSALNPIAEYMHLHTSLPSYIPLDREMNKWFTLSPGMYRLKYLFWPMFDTSYYNRDILNQLIQFTGQQVENPYEYLQIEYLSPTFYYGPLPQAQNITAIGREEIENFDTGDLLCYGVREQSNLQTISLQELQDYFNHQENLQNMFEPRSCLNSWQLRKLCTLLDRHDLATSWYNRPLTFEVLNRRKTLSNTIRKIYSQSKQLDNATLRLLNYEDFQPLNIIFQSLLELTMYMRGWSGPPSDYPIAFSLTVNNSEQEALIAQAWSKYMDLQQEYPEAWILINELPLYLYREPNYIVSKDISQGLTIGQRLKIIAQGEDGGNIESCVRMSSNWLLSSIHRYLTILHKTEPFDIKTMRYIS